MATTDNVFKSLGDPTRIRIIEMLAQNGEMCVCKIFEQLDMTQPAVSHHLAKLKNAGLVNARKEGQWIHYSVNQVALDAIKAFMEDIMRKIDATPKGSRVCGPERRECQLSKVISAAASDGKVVVG